MMVSVFLHIFALATVIHASYFIIDPLGNTTWHVNSPATIAWKITSNSNAPKATKLTVDLIAGESSNSQWVATICDNLDPFATSCTWSSVPAYLPTLPSGYSVRINYNVQPPYYDYGPKFQIIGLVTGSDSSLPRQPPPEACITDCSGNIVDQNPGVNANHYNRSNDPRFNNDNAATSVNSSSTFLVISLLFMVLS